MHNLTPLSAANTLLVELIPSLQSILGAHCIGLYLFGSAATGDLDADSDIDVLVVTDTDLPQSTVAALHTFHAGLATRPNPFADQLEIIYIPRHKLRRYDPADATYLRLDRGLGETLHPHHHHTGWVTQQHAMRQSSITLMGPPLADLIDPISPTQLRQTTIQLIHAWHDSLTTTPQDLAQRGGQSYAVLTCFRMLYTLTTGELSSKPAASAWAKQHLDSRWHDLIDRAWISRHHPSDPADPTDIAQTLDLMRYVYTRSQA
jgi:predicted nucleotidyltransferase